MSQRLINLVCIVITLAAAVYLYVLMNQYSATLPERSPAFVEDDSLVEGTKVLAPRAVDAVKEVPIQNSRERRAEMLARMRSELRHSSTASSVDERQPE